MKGGKDLKAFLDKYRTNDRVVMAAGIIEGKTYPDGTPVAHVGYVNEYGAGNTPPRSFFRASIDSARIPLGKIVAMHLPTSGAEKALALAGEYMVGELKQSVMTWTDPPNAESTVKQKGYNAPLRANDKLLRNSFSYEVNSDD